MKTTNKGETVKCDPEQCARLTHLLARMDDGRAIADPDVDPAGALLPDEIAWAAAHLDALRTLGRTHLQTDSVSGQSNMLLRTSSQR